MPTRPPDFDPTVIEGFAQRLYSKAASFVIGSVVAGATLGAAFGATPLTSLGASWPIPPSFGIATMLVGAVAGAAIGCLIGEARSVAYKLQAQTALCQLQIERNGAAASALAAAQASLVAPALTATTPEPEPEPEPTMRPVVVPQDAQLSGQPRLRAATPLGD